MSTSAAAAAAAAAQVMARATKASGVIVRVGADDFLAILRKQREPLVVHAKGGFFGTRHRYLASYKGLAFFSQSRDPIALPIGIELVEAGKIWIPD